MGTHHEVVHERLYLKQPGTEKLRKRSAGRLAHLLATGWRETDRWHHEEYVTVRVERSGVSPTIGKAPRIVAADIRPPREFNRRGPGQGQGRR